MNYKIKASKQEILDASREVIAQEGIITIRHLYYKLVGAGLIQKTEKAYKSLDTDLINWRKRGLIDWFAFADSSRRYLGDSGVQSPSEAMANAISYYTLDKWIYQPNFVEVWCEKSAIERILYRACAPYGVRILPARGNISLTAMAGAARDYQKKQSEGKEIHVLYFGDYDSSGFNNDRSVPANMKEYFNVDITFTRLAIKEDQFDQYPELRREAKPKDLADPRFADGCMDIDVLDTPQLQEIARAAIKGLIDRDQWSKDLEREAYHRQELQESWEQYFLEKNGFKPFE